MAKAFERLVLKWVQDHVDDRATKILKVEGLGRDWEGSTEEGFYSTFSVSLVYATGDDPVRTDHHDVEGEEMESLWKAVVGE